MSNHAYLVSNDNETPASRDDTGDHNYDSKEQISEGGSYIFPLLWLSAFRPDDIVQHTTEDYIIPCLVTLRETAISNIASAHDFIASEFANVSAHWSAWESLVKESKGLYLKIDGTEIWDLEPESYASSLPSALRWFASREESDRDALLEFCGLNYDEDSRLITLGADSVTGDNLYGMPLA